jgi:predicted NBD/HSP70 family sugar kinase
MSPESAMRLIGASPAATAVFTAVLIEGPLSRVSLARRLAIALARGGNEIVSAVFARAGNAIGSGIAAVANLVGPARIVVSGEGLAAYDLFETHIRTGFERQAFGTAAQCPLSIRPLPFEEWARGAATVSIQALVVA